jgi:hypothetical protein
MVGPQPRPDRHGLSEGSVLGGEPRVSFPETFFHQLIWEVPFAADSTGQQSITFTSGATLTLSIRFRR